MLQLESAATLAEINALSAIQFRESSLSGLGFVNNDFGLFIHLPNEVHSDLRLSHVVNKVSEPIESVEAVYENGVMVTAGSYDFMTPWEVVQRIRGYVASVNPDVIYQDGVILDKAAVTANEVVYINNAAEIVEILSIHTGDLISKDVIFFEELMGECVVYNPSLVWASDELILAMPEILRSREEYLMALSIELGLKSGISFSFSSDDVITAYANGVTLNISLTDEDDYKLWLDKGDGVSQMVSLTYPLETLYWVVNEFSTILKFKPAIPVVERLRQPSRC